MSEREGAIHNEFTTLNRTAANDASETSSVHHAGGAESSTIVSSISTLSALALDESLEDGNSIEIPSLGIIFTRDSLVGRPADSGSEQKAPIQKGVAG